jgi:hypothetical protein
LPWHITDANGKFIPYASTTLKKTEFGEDTVVGTLSVEARYKNSNEIISNETHWYSLTTVDNITYTLSWDQISPNWVPGAEIIFSIAYTDDIDGIH